MNQRIPAAIFALLMLALGGLCATRPVVLASFFRRFLGERKSFVAAHPQVSLASIRTSGFIALPMGAFLLYAALMAR